MIFQIIILRTWIKLDSLQWLLSGLVLKALDSQSSGSKLKTTGWLQYQLSLLSLLLSIKYVLGTPGDLVVQSKLSRRSGSALRQLNSVHKKRAIMFFKVWEQAKLNKIFEKRYSVTTKYKPKKA